MASSLRAAGLSVVVASALFGAYLYVWSPLGRPAYIRSLATPLLETAAQYSSTPWTVEPGPERKRLTLQSESPSRSLGVTAPAGIRFLLPALGLALLAPKRLYWLLLWTGHLLLGLMGLGFLVVGLLCGSPGFALYDVQTGYLIDAFSLGVATLAVIQTAGGGRTAVDNRRET